MHRGLPAVFASFAKTPCVVRPLLSLLFFLACVPALLPPALGAQQDVAYDIAVNLDDVNHVLHASLRLAYGNNSGDTLRRIPFHLWPRAYSGPTTAFARQQLRHGSTDFHFADPARRGTLDSLAFTVDDRPATLRFDEREPDIGYLTLPRPLPPGGRVEIRTPFRVKLPDSFSRLGHVGQSYQITQWYPKPVVYDSLGWHPMPYLNQGEFYSEFATFRVRITLPENYVVGATGQLREAAERQWLLERARRGAGATGTTPPSAPARKTITYHAERVHDFAWFADKDFRVRHDTLLLAGRAEPVDVWTMHTDADAEYWAGSIALAKRATRFFHHTVGPYGYPQVTAVQSALSAGAGMEYPMITVLGSVGSEWGLDRLLAHEIGHNWFYGMLGSNERDHPWLDEGLTSYYEGRYLRRYYPERAGGEEFLPGLVTDLDALGYRYMHRQGRDQAPDTPSGRLHDVNYWISAYSKPAMALRRTEERSGAAALDRAVRTYFRRHAYGHPGPGDFFAAVASVDSAAADYLRRTMLTTAPVATDLDAAGAAPGKLFGPGTAQDRPGPQFFALPLALYNAQDGFQLGGALHNRTLEPQPFEFVLAPLYAFGSRRLTGLAGGRLRLARPFGGVRQWLTSFGLQRFSDFTPSSDTIVALGLDEPFAYSRAALLLEFTLDEAPTRQRTSVIYAQLIRLARERPDFAGGPVPLEEPAERRNFYYRLGLRSASDAEIAPLDYGLRLEYRSRDGGLINDRDHLRLDASLAGAYQYEAERRLRYRFFGGYFLSNADRERAAFPAASLSLVDDAAADYAYDGLFLGRNAGGWYEQQLGRRQGGFRAPPPPGVTFGRSNNFLLATNVDADLPLPLPLGVFVDAGVFSTKRVSSEPLETRFRWVGGLSLTAFGDRLGLYLPLVSDPDTKLLLEQRGKWADRLSFRLEFSGLLPWRIVDRVY